MAYRAFVSSTYIDLKGHRAYVIDALERAGFDVDPMEDWTSDSDEPKVFSVEHVNGCDLCILLVALRRYDKCRWLLTSRIVGYDEVVFDRKKVESVRARHGHDVADASARTMRIKFSRVPPI